MQFFSAEEGLPPIEQGTSSGKARHPKRSRHASSNSKVWSSSSCLDCVARQGQEQSAFFHSKAPRAPRVLVKRHPDIRQFPDQLLSPGLGTLLDAGLDTSSCSRNHPSSVHAALLPALCGIVYRGPPKLFSKQAMHHRRPTLAQNLSAQSCRTEACSHNPSKKIHNLPCLLNCTHEHLCIHTHTTAHTHTYIYTYIYICICCFSSNYNYLFTPCFFILRVSLCVLIRTFLRTCRVSCLRRRSCRLSESTSSCLRRARRRILSAVAWVMDPMHSEHHGTQ